MALLPPPKGNGFLCHKNFMKNKFKQFKVMFLILIVVLVMTGCTVPTKDTQEPQGIAIGEPNPSTPDSDASGTSPKLSEDAAKAMQLEKTIKGIVSIQLRDLEGNTIEKDYTKEDLEMIEKAFNESFIMDTAYIEMIAGYTMTLTLENGDNVFIYSYGEPAYIVARIGEGSTYHLGCETIGKMLLDVQ